MRRMKGFFAVGAALAALAAGAAAPEAAPYYEGKVLTILQGRSAGGLGDLRVRAAVPYLQKYLPGHPQVVSQYMPGAGGVRAANQMATVVKKDGLTIANIGTSIFINAISRKPTVRYRVADFLYLGAASVGGPYGILVRPLGLHTVKDLKARAKLRFAERSVGHTMYNVGRIMAFILELDDPQWVVGYASPEVDIAVQRGEADARTEVLFDLMQSKPKWQEQGFTVPVVLRNIKGRGPEAVAGFPKAATVNDYADTPLKKDVLRFYYNSRPGSSVFFAPRGVPEEAAAALRQGFKSLWNDPQFARDYERLTAEPAEPISGEEIEKFLQEVPDDPEVMKVMEQLLGPGPLPAAR